MNRALVSRALLPQMRVLAPIEGTIEWRVAAGARVTEGDVMGWIAGPGRCGLVPLVASADGSVRWRRTSALEAIAQGEPAVLLELDGSPSETELRACLDAERCAAEPVIAALEREVTLLERDEHAHPLGLQLLRPQRVGLEARLALLRALR